MLGINIVEKTTLIEGYMANLTQMRWSRSDNHAVKCSIAKEPFVSGGFRDVYKATSLTWIVKKYLSVTSFSRSTKQWKGTP